MSKKVSQHKNNQQGVVLVMALMILTVILVTTLTLSRILLNEIKMSLNLNNAMVSFYSAESGIEKSLYHIKYSKSINDFTSFVDLSKTGFNIYDLENEQSVTIVTSTTTASSFYRYNITTSSPAHVNIIDPAGDIGGIDWGASGENQYRVHWELEDCFPHKYDHHLEITAASFADNFTDPDVQTHVIICDCGYDSDQCSDDVNSFTIYSNRFYRFTFRPLDSTVKLLSFDIADGDIGILSEAEIEAYGNYKNSQYYIKVHLPSLSPASDIFDYVIFSEERLIKDL
jgi:hypothetical protein